MLSEPKDSVQFYYATAKRPDGVAVSSMSMSEGGWSSKITCNTSSALSHADLCYALDYARSQHFTDVRVFPLAMGAALSDDDVQRLHAKRPPIPEQPATQDYVILRRKLRK